MDANLLCPANPAPRIWIVLEPGARKTGFPLKPFPANKEIHGRKQSQNSNWGADARPALQEKKKATYG